MRSIWSFALPNFDRRSPSTLSFGHLSCVPSSRPTPPPRRAPPPFLERRIERSRRQPRAPHRLWCVRLRRFSRHRTPRPARHSHGASSTASRTATPLLRMPPRVPPPRRPSARRPSARMPLARMPPPPPPPPPPPHSIHTAQCTLTTSIHTAQCTLTTSHACAA